MKSAITSATIGLIIGIGPAIAVHLMPQFGMLGQLAPFILGLIIGTEAASRRGARSGRRRPDEAPKNVVCPIR